MEDNTCNDFKLQALLSRFVDPKMLTTELIEMSHRYLFGRGSYLPFFKNTELFETIAYLKDIMNVNCLHDLGDILSYYEEKKRSLNIFIQNSFTHVDINHQESIKPQLLCDINWQKCDIEAALPKKSLNNQCLLICYAAKDSYPSPVLHGIVINTFTTQINCREIRQEQDFGQEEQKTDSLPKRVMTEV